MLYGKESVMKGTKKKLGYYRLMPYITLILLLFTILGVLNFSELTYSLNKYKYDKTYISEVKYSVDGIVAMLPKLKVTYMYRGKRYKNDKILYADMLFKGTTKNLETVYVNKGSPDDFLILPKFWSSYTNIGLVISILLCFVFFGINLRKDVKIRNERKEVKEERRKQSSSDRSSKEDGQQEDS